MAFISYYSKYTWQGELNAFPTFQTGHLESAGPDPCPGIELELRSSDAGSQARDSHLGLPVPLHNIRWTSGKNLNKMRWHCARLGVLTCVLHICH